MAKDHVYYITVSAYIFAWDDNQEHKFSVNELSFYNRTVFYDKTNDFEKCLSFSYIQSKNATSANNTIYYEIGDYENMQYVDFFISILVLE